MSDIIVTADDGSQTLVHYGVLGMKWGQRNAETLRKYGKSGNLSSQKTVAKAEKTAERFVNDKRYRNRMVKKGASKAAGTLGGVAAGSAVKGVAVAAMANPVAALAIGSTVVAGSAAAGYAAYRKLKKE